MKVTLRAIKEVCGQGRNRTADTRIFSPLLYRLSYLSTLKTKTFLFDGTYMSIRNRTFIKILFLFLIQLPMTGIYAVDMNDWRYPYQRGILQQKGEMYDYALENFNRALILKPDLYDAANRLGEIHMIKGNRREALEFYIQSLKIKDDQAGIHCRAGELYDYFAENDEAFRHFMRAVEIDPSHIRSHLHLVRHFLSAGKKEEAEKHYDESRRLCLEHAGDRIQKAIELENRGESVQALALYKKILADYPALSEIYLRMYEIYRRMHRYTEAVKVLKDLIYLQPDHPGAHARLGTMYLDSALPGKRKLNLDLAEKHLTRALELNPHNIQAMESLSDLYRLRGEKDKAERMERKSRETGPAAQP